MLQDELASALDIKKSQLSKFKARGCPVDDLGEAKSWIARNIRPRAKRRKAAAGPACEPEPIPAGPDPALGEDDFSPEARLLRARKMERAIYEAASLAISKKEYGQLQSLLASYQRSMQGLIEAEAKHAKARLEAAELVHRETAQAILAELLVPIRSALDLVPITERSRCNPQKPEVAEHALRIWKDTLLHKLSTVETAF